MPSSHTQSTTFSELGLDGLQDFIWPKSEHIEPLLAPIAIPSPRFLLEPSASNTHSWPDVADRVSPKARRTPHPLLPAPIGFAERRQTSLQLNNARPSPPAQTIHPPPLHHVHVQSLSNVQVHHVPMTPTNQHVEMDDSTPLKKVEADPFYAPPLNLKAAPKGKKAKGKKKASPVVRVRADQPTFLTKLFQMLETPEYQQSIRWEPDERTIIILDPVTLENQILPMIYKMTKFASFSRQLNIYGFMRRESLRHVLGHQTDHPDASTWNHEYLHRKSTITDLLSYKRRVNPKETSGEVAGTELGRKRRRSTLPRMTPQSATRPQPARQASISPASEISPGSVFDESPDAYAALFKGFSPTKQSATPMSAGVREAALALMGVSGGASPSSGSCAGLDTYFGPVINVPMVPTASIGLVDDLNATGLPLTCGVPISQPYTSFPWTSNPGSGSISPALLQPRPTTGGYPFQQSFTSLVAHTAPIATTPLPFVGSYTCDKPFDAFQFRPPVAVSELIGAYPTGDYIRAQQLGSLGSMAAQIASYGDLVPPHMSFPPFNSNLAVDNGQHSWGLGMSLDVASMPDLTLASTSATYGTNSAGNLSTTSLPFTSSPDEMFTAATDYFALNAPADGCNVSEQRTGVLEALASGDGAGVGIGAGIGVGVGIGMGADPVSAYSTLNSGQDFVLQTPTEFSETGLPIVSREHRTYGTEDAAAARSN